MSDVIINVLRDTRAMLAQSGNDFSWSKWESRDEALAEFDGLLNRIEAAGPIDPREIELLFAPTGSLQEVSIDSGWGDEFLRLADRAEAAAKRRREGWKYDRQ